MLEALAYGGKNVFFIQVGSNDATHNDPLRRFILERGWRGLMIEPVPHVFERLKRNYANRPAITPGVRHCRPGRRGGFLVPGENQRSAAAAAGRP